MSIVWKIMIIIGLKLAHQPSGFKNDIQQKNTSKKAETAKVIQPSIKVENPKLKKIKQPLKLNFYKSPEGLFPFSGNQR